MAGDTSGDSVFVRACTVETHMDISEERHFVWKFTGKMAGDTSGDSVFVRACAVETHMDISEEPFCMVIYWKNGGGHVRGQRFCASLRNRNAHGHFRRAILHGNLQEMLGTPPGTAFLCEPAIETHLRGQRFVRACNRNAHEHFRRAILYGNLKKNCWGHVRGQRFVRACAVESHMVNCYRKNPLQCGHTAWGKNRLKLFGKLFPRITHFHFMLTPTKAKVFPCPTNKSYGITPWGGINSWPRWEMRSQLGLKGLAAPLALCGLGDATGAKKDAFHGGKKSIKNWSWEYFTFHIIAV